MVDAASTTALAALLAPIGPVAAVAAAAARRRHATLVKPPGSLGRLEDLGVQLSAIAGSSPPPVPSRPAVVVAAADHGVHARRVTPWPQTITAQMVQVFCAGGAAVNAHALAVGARVAVLDVGCATEPPDHPLLRKVRIRPGTEDLSAQPAMTRAEAERAILAGATVAEELLADGVDLLVTGDMGIANTTASACLIAVCTGSEPHAVTGPGAGNDQQLLAHKTQVVRDALVLHRPNRADALGTLTAVGGLEHAALVGLICAAAAASVPVVLDGIVSNAAALIAVVLCAATRDYLIAGHRSTEPGATIALAHLGLEPLLDLRMRLGEGTGGLLAVPLITAAARLLSEMALVTDLSPRSEALSAPGSGAAC